MSNSAETPSVSIAANEVLQENYNRLHASMCFLLVWERLLTATDRARLGGDVEVAIRKYTTVGMWRTLRLVSRARAVIDLSRLLNFIDEGTQQWLLRETREVDDPADVLARAVDRIPLVLRESPRAAFWRGKRVPIDWDRNSALWNYVITLCEQAIQGQSLDASHFGERRKKDNHIKLKHRLTAHPQFPVDLGDLIVAVGGGQQRLQLPPSEIRILRLLVTERVDVR